MDYFLLDPKTGELRTAKPLDKEALDDSTGVINITVRVGITIIPPVFANSEHFLQVLLEPLNFNESSAYIA